jgi:hypothetical protein
VLAVRDLAVPLTSTPAHAPTRPEALSSELDLSRDRDTLRIAIFTGIAAAVSGGMVVASDPAAGIAHGFLIAAHVALDASATALITLPPAKTFLPKLRLNPRAMPVH